ncbi:MAG: rcc01693 family protein [Pseudomonadota bacterium]
MGEGRAEDDTARTDWPGLMRLGLGVLRLPPDAFWAMTPAEFRHALEGAGLVPLGGGALGRDRLAELMAAFPDHAPMAQQQ